MSRIIGRRRVGKKTVEEQTVAEEPLHIESITWGDLTWVNIVPPTEREIDYLAKNYPFHPLDLDDTLSRKQIPKVDDYPEYLFAIFHLPVYDTERRVASKRQWSAFVGDKYLVTLHTGELKTLVALFRDCQASEEARQEYFSMGSGYLLYRILDRSIDSYFPVLDKILSLIDDLEDVVFDENVESAKELSILRRDIITQRRVMFPTRTQLASLEKRLNRFTTGDLTVYYGDLMDHINKICETLDEAKEIIEVFKDTDYILATDRVNRILRILNIMATISLPFILVSSIYGMNVIMPGGIEPGNNFTTFVLLMVALIIVTGAMLIYFRRRRWI
jgi:magnesium transporter